jgi:hypothetical protein
MSSGFPSELPWAPIRRWRLPSERVLRGDIFEADEPPFDPFPTVTLVVKTAFCPLAMIHELFHGLSCPIVDEETEAIARSRRGIGKPFHLLTALIKHKVGEGELQATYPAILQEIKKEAKTHGLKLQEIRDLEYYLRPWVQHRLMEREIAANKDTYFEVQVASRVRFRSSEGTLSTYVLGKIDELDLQGNQIIERTTRGEPTSPNPPLYKDYQTWLLWKIISSLNENDIPSPWRGDYSNMRLFVETPHDKYEVQKQNKVFEDLTVWALSWIQDVSHPNTRSKTIAQIYQEAIPECKKQMKHRMCGIWLCYSKRRKYPTCRPLIHANFRWYYYSFFQDTMWKRDKFLYQLMLCSLDELRELGILYKCRIVTSRRGELKVTLDPSALDRIRRLEQEERGCILLIGSPKFGIQTNSRITSIDDKGCTLWYEWRKMPSISYASILFPEATIFRATPVFLNTLRQRRLFLLERWGKDKDVEAERNPTIQLLEAVFGGRRLETGVSHVP